MQPCARNHLDTELTSFGSRNSRHGRTCARLLSLHKILKNVLVVKFSMYSLLGQRLTVPSIKSRKMRPWDDHPRHAYWVISHHHWGGIIDGKHASSIYADGLPEGVFLDIGFVGLIFLFGCNVLYFHNHCISIINYFLLERGKHWKGNNWWQKCDICLNNNKIVANKGGSVFFLYIRNSSSNIFSHALYPSPLLRYFPIDLNAQVLAVFIAKHWI